jgi:hypothetical protein
MAFGEVTVAWRLLDMAVIAYPGAQKKGKGSDFHRGKVLQAAYFVDTVLPQTLASLATCLRHGREVVEMPDSAF